MRNYLSHSIRLFSLSAILLILGCREESLVSTPVNPTADKVQVELFTRATAYSPPLVRASANENALEKTPWVLVFKGEDENATFVEAVKAEILSDTKVYVYLTLQTAKCQLLILANPQESFYGNTTDRHEFSAGEINTFLSGQKLSDACAMLLTEPLNSPQQTSPPFVGVSLPMSCLLAVNEINSTTKIGNSTGDPLYLRRAVAKLIVQNTASNFELEGITALVNAPIQGQLHNLSTTSPTTGSGNLTEYRTDAAYSSDIAPAVSGTTASNPLYLYESKTDGNNTCLLVKGKYKGETYYYKMALIDNEEHTMDILRNKEYTYTIAQVNGAGFTSASDAKVSKASNLFKILLRVIDPDSFETVANNDYYLSVSNSRFIAYSDPATFEAFTLVNNCTKGFSSAARSITAGKGLTIVEPLGGVIPLTGNQDNPVSCTVRIQAENGFTGPGYVTVQLGNLKQVITVERKDPISRLGTTLQYFDSSTGEDVFSHYLLSGTVEGAATSWIKLLPSGGIIREDADNIHVEDGKIYVQVYKNTQTSVRQGSVFLSTVTPPSSNNQPPATYRIKLYIAQQAGTAS